jgi:hypothetical protein
VACRAGYKAMPASSGFFLVFFWLFSGLKKPEKNRDQYSKPCNGFYSFIELAKMHLNHALKYFCPFSWKVVLLQSAGFLTKIRDSRMFDHP